MIKKGFSISLILVFLLTACKTKDHKLYVFVNQNEFQIKTLKILKLNSDQLHQKNIFNRFNDKISFQKTTCYIYDIPCGNFEIYLEYFYKGSFYNERKKIILNCNVNEKQWVAISFSNSQNNPVKLQYGLGNCNLLPNSE
jgi:hypothetical protein